MSENKNFDFIFVFPGKFVTAPLKVFSIDKGFLDRLSFCFELFRILHFASKNRAGIENYGLGEAFYEFGLFIYNYIPLYLLAYALLFKICYLIVKFRDSMSDEIDILVRIRISMITITLFYYDPYKFEFYAHLLTPLFLVAILKWMLNNFSRSYKAYLEDSLVSLILHFTIRHYSSNKFAICVFLEWLFVIVLILCNIGVCAVSCYYIYYKTSEMLQNKHSSRIFLKKMRDKAILILAATIYNVFTYLILKFRYYHILFYYFSLVIEAALFTTMSLDTNINLEITLPNSLIGIFLSLLLALYFNLV